MFIQKRKRIFMRYSDAYIQNLYRLFIIACESWNHFSENMEECSQKYTDSLIKIYRRSLERKIFIGPTLAIQAVFMCICLLLAIYIFHSITLADNKITPIQLLRNQKIAN